MTAERRPQSAPGGVTVPADVRALIVERLAAALAAAWLRKHREPAPQPEAAPQAEQHA